MAGAEGERGGGEGDREEAEGRLAGTGPEAAPTEANSCIILLHHSHHTFAAYSCIMHLHKTIASYSGIIRLHHILAS